MRRMVPVLALILALPAAAAPPSKAIILERRVGKKPVPVPRLGLASLAGRPVSLEVVDGRGIPDPAVVGSQEEMGQVLYEWRSATPTGQAIPGWVEQALRDWGVSIDQDSEVRLWVLVTKFRVDEIPETFGSTYKAEVSLRGGLRDKGSADAPSRRVTGTAKRGGPDRRAKICNEVLTAALDDALAQLLTPQEETGKPPTFTVKTGDPDAVPPKVMLQELVRLKDAGVGEPVLLGYVKQRKLSAPLTVDEILEWKVSGLPESVIQAAQEAK